MLTKAEVARLRSLREKKHRDELGLFVVEGEKVVGELLANEFPLEAVYATPSWQSTVRLPASTTRHDVSAEEMARISHFPTPSAVLAVARIERRELQVSQLESGITLLLDGIQDAGNLGTLLRIADWYAIDRVVTSPDCVDLFNQKVIHASMGSFSRVPVYSAQLDRVLAGVNTPVLGCDLVGESVHSLAPLSSAIVAIGSEGRGLSPSVRARVTRFVTIPRLGAAESLNAAVAAAIVCDNLRRTQGAK